MSTLVPIITDERLIEGAKCLVDLIYTSGRVTQTEPGDELNPRTITSFKYEPMDLLLIDSLLLLETSSDTHQLLQLVRTKKDVRFTCTIEYEADECTVRCSNTKSLEATILEYQFNLG